MDDVALDHDDDRDVDAVASLGDPRRRALYRYVVEHRAGVGRDDAARAVGMSRPLAAYHLDRMVNDGLLTARFERTSRRAGPGAGRPSKLYERSKHDIEVRLPPREYELAARLFARALDQTEEADARAAMSSTARQVGRELGGAHAGRGRDGPGGRRALEGAMRALGYEPVGNDEEVRLRNCPFDALVDEHRDLVCHMNLALVGGLVEGCAAQYEAVLDPRPGDCCVRLYRAEDASTA